MAQINKNTQKGVLIYLQLLEKHNDKNTNIEIRELRLKEGLKMRKLKYCKVSCGTDNLSFHAYLSNLTIDFYRNKGYKVQVF